jgi:F0F1-type ATP synthase membrane subunit b/b'
MSEWVVIWSCIAGVGILLILVVRLLISVSKINSSIAKLGYVIREDAKKYFDEAAHSIVETNEQFQEQYVGIVRDGTKSALSDASTVMEGTLAKAQQDAGTVILQAREEARRIVEAARAEAGTYKQQALDQSTATIQWVMEQYAGQAITVEQHEALIKTLVDQYTYENRN